jgi:hypothetical protein
VTIARDAKWKAREVQRDEEIGWGEHRRPSSPLGGWPGTEEHHKEWVASDSRVRTSYHSINCGWPSIEGGVKVTVEVCSDASKIEDERTPAAYPPVTGQGRLNGCGSAKAG